MIDPELLPEFVAEAGEHLDEMEANLIKLEAAPDNREIINDIFRDIHTIKGSSAYLGLKVTSELAHKLENLLEMVRQGKLTADSSLIDTLIAAKDRMTSLVADVENYQEERTDTDDLLEAIQSCSNDLNTNEKKVGQAQPSHATDLDQNIDLTEATLEGIRFEAEQNSNLDPTDVDRPRQDTPSGNSLGFPMSFSEDKFKLDLEGIFDTEETQSSVPSDTIESCNDSPKDSPPIQAASAPQGSFAEDQHVESGIEESYDETGDEELFTIYLEQLKIKLSDIRELAVQITSSENRSELLSAINKKIQRLKASANYMGYDKLAGFYERWQAKLESYQDRLFLNDPPSCDVLIEEGINTYFGAIEKHFPLLQEIARVPIAGEKLEPFPSRSPSSENRATPSPIDDVHGQDDAGIDEKSLSPVDQGSPQGNSQRSPISFSEDEFKLDLDGIFDTEEHQSSVSADTFESGKDIPSDPAPIQAVSAPQGSLVEDIPVEFAIEEPFQETGDEELFLIYLEQLKINLSDIRELAVQISSSENHSELLRAINEKIERLKASANYMGYDKLAGFYEHWQTKIESYKDRLVLNDPPSCDVLIEEGINIYFDAIQKHFPQLQQIARVSLVDKELENFPSQAPPFEVSDTPLTIIDVHDQNDAGLIERSLPQAENEYDEKIDTELFSIFLEQLKDNLYAVRTLGQQISTSENPPDIVKALTEKVTRIRAAANYMGYEKLTELYDGWAGALNAFHEPSSYAANGIDISNRIKGCISTYTEKLLKIFPQLNESELVAVDETETTAEEQLPITPLSSTNETSTLEASENGLHVDRTDELFSSDDTSGEDEGNLYEQPGVTEDEATVKDQILIDRLSAALDRTLGTGFVGKGNNDSGKRKNNSAKVEPDQSLEDSPVILQEIPLEKTISLESLEPSEPVQLENRVDLARNDENFTAVPKHEERRKEDRRTEDRRAAPEVGVDKVLRQSLRIDANKIDELMNQAGELVINRAWFSQLFNEMRRLELHLQNLPELDKRDLKQVKGFSFKFHEAIVALGRVANELQEGVMKVRMLPISQLFNRYPRLIRDLVHDSDKDLQLVLRGADTELDKMIIEEIADPLIHVIRNAVDHGIEPASTRKMMGKPEKGLLRLDAYHEGSHVVIEVTDDGRGINPEAIKSAALKKGLVSKDQLSRMSAKEITELIMRPGFSTAAQVTRTSGRGVGMDVVRKNLENLNGTIEIDSQPGKGTSIRIKIPLTLAVIKALLVKVRNALFTIPLIAVDETLRVHAKNISSIKGNEVIYLRDSTIPLIRLSTIFNLPGRPSHEIAEEKTFVVIVSAGNSRVGLVVDELRGQEEVVIKPLPDYLRDNKGFSGATILGDGRISLILDIHELVNLTIGRQSRRLSESSGMISETL